MRISLLVCALSLIVGCAKETSQSERQREEQDRDFQRLQPATGTYNGSVSTADGGSVPASLVVAATRNPVDGKETPIVSASLHLGLFGGVTIASDTASYDWGSGKLAASFKRPTGGPLELHAVVKGDVLQNAVLAGPTSGEHAMTMSKNSASLFEDKNEFIYQLSLATKIGLQGTPSTLNAQMILKLSPTEQKAPGTSDLPLLPSMEASVRVAGMASTPQNAKTVMYDPLTGTLDVWLSDTSRLSFDHVFLSDNSNAEAQLSGHAMVGGTDRGSISAKRSDHEKTPEELGDMPPLQYRGTYKSSSSPFEFDAFGYFTVVGTTGTNSDSFLFPSFPNLHLIVYVCFSDGKYAEDYSDDLVAVDHMVRTAYFKPIGGANDGNGSDNSDVDLTLTFSDGFKSLDGKYFRHSSGNDSNGIALSTLHLEPANLGSVGCH